MNLWDIFTTKVKYLINANIKKDVKLNEWKNLQNKINKLNFIPSHFGNLMKFSSYSKMDTENIKILDHGCGSALTICFLILKGYKNVWGITVNFENDPEVEKKIRKINKFIKIILDAKYYEDRIKVYNGKVLPFKNKSFDLVMTQQVLEHIPNKEIENFILEEKRILKDDGVLYHQIPHRLVPFEAHTKVWFIHWFPKSLRNLYFKNNKYKLEFITRHLFLLWPWQIKSLFIKNSMFVNDITKMRLRDTIYTKELKGINLILRICLQKLFIIPFIGKVLSNMLSKFFMLEIFVKKKS